MREIIARIISILSVAVVIAISLLFASAHNPPVAAVAAPAAGEAGASGPAPLAAPGAPHPGEPAPASNLERGRAVYAQNQCATCHAIAGEGNPRYPLDGVGARWEPEDLRDWITGDGVAAEVLSAGIIRRKQRYRSLPEADLDALVAYLSTLRPTDQPEETQ